MATVKMLVPTRYEGNSVKRGDTIEVSNLIADRWRKRKIANVIKFTEVDPKVEDEVYTKVPTIEVPKQNIESIDNKEKDIVIKESLETSNQKEEVIENKRKCDVSMDNNKSTLIAYATEKGIEVNDRMKKEEILDKIYKSI